MSTPFKEPTIKITFFDNWYTYTPKEDITTFELAKIHQLITVACVSATDPKDRDNYMLEYNLVRHFTLVEES